MSENDRAQRDSQHEADEDLAASDVAPPDDAAFEEAVDIEALQAELAKVRDHALRSQAELENFRKRAARQMDEERRYANLPLLRDLLHVWDNINLAIEAARQDGRNDSLLEGFSMVVRQMEETFNRYHCTKIEAVGKPFDPHLHEAILQQPSAEHPHGTVTQEIQTGFQLHDRVVRPSRVIVSTAPNP